MKSPFIIGSCMLLILVKGQDDDFFSGLEEVTKPAGQSIGAIEKCGEGSDQGAHACVPYHMCDGKTKTIVQTGVTDGFGIIDIRFGENACSHPLEVCCKIPEGGLDPKFPLPGEQPLTTSTQIPPPIDVEPPVVVTPQPSPSYCGIRHPDGIDFKITGNKDNEAEYGEFTWMVAILNKNYRSGSSDQNVLVCGGSLITPIVVLTAAHCVSRAKNTDLTIRTGEWDTQTTRERLPYQERDVADIIFHEQFNSKTAYNDFALLVLSKPVSKADNIGTICLPTQGQRIDTRHCYVSGWGKDVFGKEGKFQAILKKIELPIVQRKQCEVSLRNTRLGENFQLHNSFLCAGGVGGKDACTGDGGSPLVCPDPHNPQRYVQAGIVAWGIGCGEEDVPGVYADVAKFRSWIDRQMERLNLDTTPYNL